MIGAILVAEKTVSEGIATDYARVDSTAAMFHTEPFEPSTGRPHGRAVKDMHALRAELFDAKRRRRLEMARLPIEVRIRILPNRRRRRNAIGEAMGHPPLPVWPESFAFR